MSMVIFRYNFLFFLSKTWFIYSTQSVDEMMAAMGPHVDANAEQGVEQGVE